MYIIFWVILLLKVQKYKKNDMTLSFFRQNYGNETTGISGVNGRKNPLAGGFFSLAGDFFSPYGGFFSPYREFFPLERRIFAPFHVLGQTTRQATNIHLIRRLYFPVRSTTSRTNL